MNFCALYKILLILMFFVCLVTRQVELVVILKILVNLKVKTNFILFYDWKCSTHIDFSM